MLYRTLPAAAARDGMLRPSGPLKNSGKIVTTLILSGTRYSPPRDASIKPSVSLIRILRASMSVRTTSSGR
jgi:hypothetical protein